MEVAPPPPPGSRIQELGDRLIVRFRPRRSWGAIAFLTFWLTFWTFGGIAALHALPRADWGGRGFILFWLCGWSFGECAVIVIIAWQLFGREFLTITPQHLEVRQEIGRFARTKRYDVGLVHDVRAARVPSDEDDKPRKDFCLVVSYNEKTVRVGEGMGEREAEYIASTVLGRIRPRARWSDEERADPYDANDRYLLHAGDDNQAAAVAHADAEYLEASMPLRRAAAVAATLIVGLALGGTAIALLRRDEPAPQMPKTPSAAQEFSGPPSAQEFSDPREFASAMTFFSLTSARTKVLGRPDCGAHVTWTEWACTAPARATIGPYAGRTLTYRCYPTYTEQPGGRPAVHGLICGPENPPQITGAGASCLKPQAARISGRTRSAGTACAP